MYRYLTGIPWRDLPEHFGPWQSVWKRRRRYSLDGTWDQVLAALLTRADAAGLINWEVSVGSTVNRVHQRGSNMARHTGGPVELQESVPWALSPCDWQVSRRTADEDSLPR